MLVSALVSGLMAAPRLRAEPAAGAAMTLSGRTLDGRPFNLGTAQGKVVLAIFWSTECAVCRDKMPELRLNYEAWRSRRFELIAVNVDRSEAAFRDYESILGRTVAAARRFPSVWRGAPEHTDSFGAITHTPTTFVLDRQHRVVSEVRGRIPPGLWDDLAELVLA